jgi:hypothetical protein
MALAMGIQRPDLVNVVFPAFPAPNKTPEIALNTNKGLAASPTPRLWVINVSC